MFTQRVNFYDNANMRVFFIEEYNPEIRAWVAVGDTFDKYEIVETIVNLHNARELANHG